MTPNMFNDLLSGNVDLESAGKMRTRPSTYITLPKAGQTLVGKFLVVPEGPSARSPYLPAPYYEFMIGDDRAKDTRMHFSIGMAGVECPIKEAYWDAMKARKVLKDEGDRTSNKYKSLDHRVSMLRPKTGAFVWFIELGSDKIQLLFIKETMIDALFGRKAEGDRGPVRGLVPAMKEEGRSPFNLKDSTGWVILSKEGSGRDTKFNVIEYTTVQEVELNGKRLKARASAEAAVSDTVIDTIKAGEWPKVDAVFQNQYAFWTKEECQEYVESYKVPDRFFKKAFRENSDQAPSATTKTEDLLSGSFDIVEEVTESSKNTEPLDLDTDTTSLDDMFE